jgi:hypothetical protein
VPQTPNPEPVARSAERVILKDLGITCFTMQHVDKYGIGRVRGRQGGGGGGGVRGRELGDFVCVGGRVLVTTVNS